MCDSSDVEQVLKLAPTPPANAFVPRELLDSPQESFPLDVFFCASCAHVQLLDVVDPGELFESYVYVSGTSPVFVEHFRRYADALLTLREPSPDALVVDVGSNDGTLLGFFQKAGCRVLGIDPAKDIARAATERGIETLPEFFTPKLARELREERGAAAIVTANNVFAHADDLLGFAEGVRTLLAPDGVFSFEVSYLVDVFEKTLFDTIYHEHLAYHSVKPLEQFLRRAGLELIDAQRVDTHGGSLRGTAQVAGGPREIHDGVAELVELEAGLGLHRADTLRGYSNRIDAIGAELGALLRDLRARGKSIAGFGAPAKATTLMHHFRLGPEVIDFIVDDSPLKQGLYTPGFHVPVVPSAEVYEKTPDYLLLLAWNFAEPIMKKHARFTEGGGHFIVPLPTVEVR